jgi:hypothetical protein
LASILSGGLLSLLKLSLEMKVGRARAQPTSARIACRAT